MVSKLRELEQILHTTSSRIGSKYGGPFSAAAVAVTTDHIKQVFGENSSLKCFSCPSSQVWAQQSDKVFE